MVQTATRASPGSLSGGRSTIAEYGMRSLGSFTRRIVPAAPHRGQRAFRYPGSHMACTAEESASLGLTISSTGECAVVLSAVPAPPARRSVVERITERAPDRQSAFAWAT